MVIVVVPNLGQKVVILVLSCVVFDLHKVLDLRRNIVVFVVSSSVKYARIRLSKMTVRKTVADLPCHLSSAG